MTETQCWDVCGHMAGSLHSRREHLQSNFALQLAATAAVFILLPPQADSALLALLGPARPRSHGPEPAIRAQLCKRAVHVAQQAPCTPDRGFYGGSIVLRVDAFKPDATWMRLQAVQTVHPLASISVQTSTEAVVRSAPLCACSPVGEAFMVLRHCHMSAVHLPALGHQMPSCIRCPHQRSARKV